MPEAKERMILSNRVLSFQLHHGFEDGKKTKAGMISSFKNIVVREFARFFFQASTCRKPWKKERDSFLTL
jgi:hypothetical protein